MRPHRPLLMLPRLALAAFCLTAEGCDPGSPLDPTGPADESTVPAAEPGALVATTRIAFVSNRNGQYDIYRMDATGQSVVRLTSSPLSETEPAWSADNKRVALVRYRTSTAGKTRRDVYIVDADGSNGHWARTLTCDCDLGHPSWSPDNSRLAITMSLNGTNYIAYLILATGQLGTYSTGYGGLPGTWPTYTKSGQIVYVGPTGKTVFRMNGDASGIKPLFTSSNYLAQPALSPDGSRLLYVQAVDQVTNNTDIFLRNLATGTTKKIGGSSAPEAFPSWSADGSRIAFSSGRTGVSQVYTTDATGGNLTRITHTTTAEGSPVWSR